jgi:hypothetical protein
MMKTAKIQSREDAEQIKKLLRLLIFLRVSMSLRPGGQAIESQLTSGLTRLTFQH